MSAITIRRENGQRNAYLGGKFIASIHDFRAAAKTNSKVDRFSTIQDNWGVAWTSGRYDWHGTYGEARDNVLKGPATR
ncbi:hypothetical protein [Piscinibacter gummiphilus]|uniref:Uncharacterized protein n=1 Tax=Piscinibacter gummiphilus TaxID=946333 RepID=A0ABZ0CVG7_9BURK|nr:hypothetical protein [Piscinibacter gummiphilus]WOB06509.1 hypothetical protein RXV79_16425 [Piscinibacter gummiphilus]